MHFFKKNRTEINYILFEVTEQCNLSCSFCYNYWKRDGEKEEQPDRGYISSIKTLKRLFRLANIRHVTFTGGEPLLAERIGELILYCRMKGATVSLITNGNAGGEKEFSKLIAMGVGVFELPVHSFEASTHDRMTCKTGSWGKSINSMKKIKELGGYVVPVVVVTRYNYHKMGETLEYIHSLGFNRVMLNRYNIGGKSAASPCKVSATKEELNEAFSHANEMAGRLNLTVSSNVCTPHCVVDPLQYRNIRFTNCSNDLYHRPLTLTTTGDLRFCNHSPSVLGNIFSDSFETIIGNGTAIGSLLLRPEICSGCMKYEKCLGGCRAAAEQTGGSFRDVDPIVLFCN
jgi:radical SAM protein with 4Fe4S-binding SPASM domain